jgi:radical SAM superfamily enzyme YgiQ (UPF0313 family)
VISARDQRLVSTLSATIDAPPARSLAASGAVLLVSCYELGHQPLSLATPAAALRAAGFHPATLDASVEQLSDDAIRAAGLIAISVPMHTALRLGAAIAARARTINPAAHICFYGLYATLNADHLLGQHHGDSTIGGEYERPLVALAIALALGAPISDLPGVGTRLQPAGPVLEPSGPITPDRTGLPALRDYAGLEREGTIVPAGYVEATRGCHHVCRHCPITPVYGGRFVVVPREVVLSDARAQVAAGARHLTFGDPDFYNGPGHGMRILRTLHAEFPWLTFDATIKIEHLIQHQRLLPELASLGCAFVVSAVESVSGLVLQKLAKGHSRDDIGVALDLLDAAGIPMRPSLLPFTPWTTVDDYVELLQFVAGRDLIDCVDPVHFSIRLLVPPGSALLDDPANATWLGDLDSAAFTYHWSHPDPRLDEMQRHIAAIVEDAAARGEPARATFGRIWTAAHAVAGTIPPPLPIPVLRRRPPPRLTESWFC